MTRLGVLVPPDGDRDHALISVVTPMFNEVDGVVEFHRRVSLAVKDEQYELLFVNDGSTDGTREAIDQLAREDPRVRVLHLSRNFGHQAALTAGVENARGVAIVTIDGDLQDPPETIPELVRIWRDGADVVHAVRHVRPGEPRARLVAIRLFYRVFAKITKLDAFPGNTGDFRLVSARVLAVVGAMPERNRFLRGLIAWSGFRQDVLVYERAERFSGTSKYPLRKLAQLAGDAIVAFSAFPLRLATYVGLLFAVAAFLTIPVVVALRLAGLYAVSGIASVHILVLLVGGLQLLFLGLFGEYLGRTYDESKRRPVYVAEAPADS